MNTRLIGSVGMSPERKRQFSNVIIAISDAVAAWEVTQTEAARRLGVTPPRLNVLLRGRIGNFSLDGLVALAARVGSLSAFGNPRWLRSQ
jgi:predicted XRE-type DNA-binding protein